MTATESVQSIENQSNDSNAPKDKLLLIYGLLFLLGVVNYLPWNFFNIATDYWMYKFRNTTINETDSELRTTLQADYNASLNITLQITDVVSMIASMIFGGLIKVSVRMIGGMSIILVLLSAMAAFVSIDTDHWQVGFFAAVITMVAIINTANGLFTITLFTILSAFPQEYLAVYLTGGGCSQVFSPALQILSLTMGVSTLNSALIYFTVGAAMVGLSLFAFIVATTQSEFYSYYAKDFQQSKTEESSPSLKESVVILKKIWTSVVTMMALILAYNASPVALVVSEGEGNGPWNDIYFIPTVTYLMGAICELIGRAVSFKYTFKMNSVALTVFAVGRAFVIVPLVFMCNAQPRDHLPVVFPHDYQYIVVMVVFSLTDGYLRSLCTYNIPKLVSKEEMKAAHHLNMIANAIERTVLSFVTILAVKLL